MRIIEETEYWGSEGAYECNPILLTEEEIARYEGIDGVVARGKK